MKNIFTTLASFVFILLSASSFGQFTKICLQHEGTTSYYSVFDDALTASTHGDTIYLPGGPLQVNASAIVISKSITLVGVGHFPDSTNATNRTQISKEVYLLSGADGGSLEGIAFLSNVRFGSSTSNQNVNNFTINRCYLAKLYTAVDDNSTSQNMIINECYLQSIDTKTVGSVLFSRNIIYQGGIYQKAAVFTNNVFYLNSSAIYMNNSVCENNVFMRNNANWANIDFYAVNYCTFNRNLFCSTYYQGLSVSNVPSTTYFNQNLTNQTVAATFTGPIASTSFQYTDNLHLKPTSPGVNYGTDGTDVGIYGTLYPFKEGGVPFNPHISSKNISNQVSPSGKLGVDIKVIAQPR